MSDAAQTGDADPAKRTAPTLLVTSAVQPPAKMDGNSINADASGGVDAFAPRHR